MVKGDHHTSGCGKKKKEHIQKLRPHQTLLAGADPTGHVSRADLTECCAVPRPSWSDKRCSPRCASAFYTPKNPWYCSPGVFPWVLLRLGATQLLSFITELLLFCRGTALKASSSTGLNPRELSFWCRASPVPRVPLGGIRCYGTRNSAGASDRPLPCPTW